MQLGRRREPTATHDGMGLAHTRALAQGRGFNEGRGLTELPFPASPSLSQSLPVGNTSGSDGHVRRSRILHPDLLWRGQLALHDGTGYYQQLRSQQHYQCYSYIPNRCISLSALRSLPPYLMNCNTPYTLMYKVRFRVSQRLKHASPVTKVKHRKVPIVCSTALNVSLWPALNVSLWPASTRIPPSSPTPSTPPKSPPLSLMRSRGLTWPSAPPASHSSVRCGEAGRGQQVVATILLAKPLAKPLPKRLGGR
jgi:hypothetical protein